MYPNPHFDSVWANRMGQEAEQAHPLAGFLTYSADGSKPPAVRSLHNRLHAFKHLHFFFWLSPE